jgi:hypothetical protein
MNTVTGQAGEPSFVVVLKPEVFKTGPGAIESVVFYGVLYTNFIRGLRNIARKYGQLEYAFTDGQSETVGVSNVES